MWRFRVLVGAGCVTLMAGLASAEIVTLANGRTLSVRAHHDDGSTIVLSLRSGGELVCALTLVTRIDPDEVPYPEPDTQRPTAGVDEQAAALTPYAAIIDELAATHGVDPRLVRAVIRVESAFEPRARSPKGAMGLMQLMPVVARQYAVNNPYDPRANLEAGIRHLKDLLGRFDLSLALAAYNAGEAAVRRFGGIPPYPETREYVKQVLALSRMAAGG
jgi:soluble lytic murein transglycosylase-like protein